MMNYEIFSLVICATVVFAQVPSYVKVCGRKNPNLDRCVQNSVDSLRDKLRTGIPELKVPPLEPLELPEGLPLADSRDLKAYARNVKLFNIYRFDIKDLHIDLDAKQIDLDVVFKNLKLKGDYDVTAKIVVPVSGKGPIEIDAEDIEAKVGLKFQLANTRKGKQMYFPSMTCKLTIKRYNSRFVAREGPDATFGEIINSVLNSGQQDIIDGITPSLERVISSRVLDLANTICKNFTYDELFPDRE